MDKATVVATDFSIGANILDALYHSELSISVAMWVYAAEYEDWRFLVASRRLDAAKPREAYGLVHQALLAEGISVERTPTLMTRKMSDPLIRELRQRFSKTKSVEGMRLGGQQIGDGFIESAIIYRIR